MLSMGRSSSVETNFLLQLPILYIKMYFQDLKKYPVVARRIEK